MLSLDQIRDLLAAGSYDLSRHAFRRAVERNISSAMIQSAGCNAEIIEDYPDDKYSPSCLLLGFAADRSPLHIQVSRADGVRVKVITLYVPDLGTWQNLRVRKGQR
jgi:hypothetical protein